MSARGSVLAVAVLVATHEIAMPQERTNMQDRLAQLERLVREQQKRIEALEKALQTVPQERKKTLESLVEE